jgi:hypothetical protein
MGRTRLAARAVGWACGGALIAGAPAHAAPQLVKVGDFAQPVYATGDASRVFVVERAGRVQLVRDGAVSTFLDLTPIVESGYQERGLLSIALAPGRVYVYLTATAAAATSGTAGEIQVREYPVTADVADAAAGRLLLAIRHDEAVNHNGGQLQFGPDGKLWLGTGDGGGGNDQFGHAHDPASLLGKLIRLDPAAPAPEIVSVGLRNPWRFSFDRATGRLVIGDVGQNAYEEIDAGLAADYGWPCREGAHAGPRSGCAGSFAEPVVEQPHGAGWCSITGGYVVRDPGLPTLLGRYLYGDYCKGELRSTDLAGGDAATGLSVPSLSSFGEDACGRLFAVSLDGPVFRIVDGAPSPCTAAPSPPAGVAPPPADTRACSLAARVIGLRSVRRRHRVSVALRVDEACRATVSGRWFKTTRASLKPGARRVLRLRLTTKGVRRLRAALRRHRSLRMSVRVQVVDGAGNLRTLSRRVRVRG